MSKTAGEILAEMIKAKERGEDTTEKEKEFREQTARQLGPYAQNIQIRREVKS